MSACFIANIRIKGPAEYQKHLDGKPPSVTVLSRF